MSCRPTSPTGRSRSCASAGYEQAEDPARRRVPAGRRADVGGGRRRRGRAARLTPEEIADDYSLPLESVVAELEEIGVPAAKLEPPWRR